VALAAAVVEASDDPRSKPVGAARSALRGAGRGCGVAGGPGRFRPAQSPAGMVLRRPVNTSPLIADGSKGKRRLGR
jgi:hypothetical protein